MAVCNMDCFKCIHADCINDEDMSPELEYYYANREKILAQKKAARRAKKEEALANLKQNN
jgi:hypothetical protein